MCVLFEDEVRPFDAAGSAVLVVLDEEADDASLLRGQPVLLVIHQRVDHRVVELLVDFEVGRHFEESSFVYFGSLHVERVSLGTVLDHPRVVEDLLGGRPGVWSSREHAFDELFSIVRQILGVEDVCAGDSELHLCGCQVSEGHSFSEDEVQQQSAAPDVCLFSFVVAGKQQLGCDACSVCVLLAQQVRVCAHLDCFGEVGDFEVELVVEEYVVGVDGEVSYSAGVEVVDCRHELPKELGCGLVCQERLALDVALEAAVGAELLYEADVARHLDDLRQRRVPRRDTRCDSGRASPAAGLLRAAVLCLGLSAARTS